MHSLHSLRGVALHFATAVEKGRRREAASRIIKDAGTCSRGRTPCACHGLSNLPAALLSLRCHAAATLNFWPEPLSSRTEQGVGTLHSVYGVGKRRDGGRGTGPATHGETVVEKGELR